jgi:hypothetical protein
MEGNGSDVFEDNLLYRHMPGGIEESNEKLQSG